PTSTLFPYTTLFRSVCNCVTPHLYHVIQGAHYEPWRNRESSRFAYERIPTIADHLHFVGRHAAEKLGTRAEDEAGDKMQVIGNRSEEHTSELQSLRH